MGNPSESPAVCSALPRQVQFMQNWYTVPQLGRVRLTRTSLVVASGPVTCKELQVSLSCLPLYHNDPGSVLWLRHPRKISLVLSIPCEQKVFSEDKMIPKRRRKKFQRIFLSVSQFSYISSRHSEMDGGYREGEMQVTISGWIFFRNMDLSQGKSSRSDAERSQLLLRQLRVLG